MEIKEYISILPWNAIAGHKIISCWISAEILSAEILIILCFSVVTPLVIKQVLDIIRTA